jgi:Uma2 family endonuclease
VEECVPETKRHLEQRTLLYQILQLAFGREAAVGSEQFVYWDPTDPSACLAPDAFVRLGSPDDAFESWKVWERGAPHLAVEIVSKADARDADWAAKLAKYRRLGVMELVRFDPAAAALPLRVWDDIDGVLEERAVSNGAAAECRPLGAHWIVGAGAGWKTLRLARDAAGAELLPTPAEAAAIEARTAERVRDDALRRVRELEDALGLRGE